MSEVINPFEMTSEQLKEAQAKKEQVDKLKDKVDLPWDDSETIEKENSEGQMVEEPNPVIAENDKIGIEHSTGPITEQLPPPQTNSPDGQPIFQHHQQPATMKAALMGAVEQVINHDQIIQNQQTNQNINTNVGQQMNQQPSPFVEQPQPDNNGEFDNYTNDYNNRKYKIFDLYWFWGSNIPLSISYNIDFDNLRFSFYTGFENANGDTAVELNALSKQCTFNVFSEVAEEMLNIFDLPEWKIKNKERIFKRSDSWSPCPSGFIKQNGCIKVVGICDGLQYEYSFNLPWEINALRRSLEFAVKESRILKISKFQ